MATITSLRFRRNAAQLHALAGVEREIRANDHNGRRKYLQAFSNAFRNYDVVIDPPQLKTLIHSADTILIGDYHALPASQRFAASLLEERAQPGDRPVVLGVETIFARDQHILDEWWRREIDEHELRERIRYDRDWGYSWEPFYQLLVTAREHAEAIYGLDCMPREDLRKIGVRDRHAAHKIAEIRQTHPHAVILILFGESHLAPDHLPKHLQEHLSADRVVTILQNVDALYWHAAGEQREQVEAVQLAKDVVCIFNSTPLEKYENYRLCLARWQEEHNGSPDAGPTIYNLIDGLVRFLGINRYSSHNTTQPKFLIDLLPEVYCPATDGQLRRLLAHRDNSEQDFEALLRRIDDRGSIYISHTNSIYVREFQMMYAAEEAARFLHHACRGLPSRGNSHAKLLANATDQFCAAILEFALGYVGSRVLYPCRPAVRGADFDTLSCKAILDSAIPTDPAQFSSTAERFGYLLGSELYDAYLNGRLNKNHLRRLFLAHLYEAGRAPEICCDLIERTRPCRTKER